MGRLRRASKPSPYLLIGILCAGSPAVAAPPDDPLFLGGADGLDQWNLMGTAHPDFPEAGVRGIDAEGAWEITLGTPDVVIAVLDSGVLLTHPDLAANIDINATEAIAAGIPDVDADGLVTLEEAAMVVSDLDDDGAITPKDVLLFASDGVDDDENGYVDDLVGWDFEADDNDPTDVYGHGTGRAGIAAAVRDNGIGLSGVCPGCRILPVRFGRTFVATPDKLAEAVGYAADRGVAATVMATGSLGNSFALRRAIAYADERGVVQCAAIGNERSRHPHFPQSYEQVIAVTGITPADREAPEDWSATWIGSNRGGHAAFAAPTYVWATSLDGGYSFEGGTSSSVPHCAGVAGLVVSRARELGVDLSARQVRSILVSSSDDAPAFSAGRGAGRVNARKAVLAVEEGAPPNARLIGPRWYTTLGPGPVTFEAAATGVGSITVEAGDGVEPSSWTPVNGSVSATPPGVEPLDDALGSAFAATLRLTVVDEDGLVTTDRRTFYVHDDPDLLSGYPKDLGESVEGAPVLVDLDGDGLDEIVVATSGGRVHALRADGSDVSGWPVDLGPPVALHDGAAAHEAGGVPTCCAAVVGTVAVGDIDGDLHPDVVITGLDGLLYAWDKGGAPLAGFPLDLGAPAWAGPVLADLDGDDVLDVIAAGYDRSVHAYDGSGEKLPGFPVGATDDTATGAPPGLVATPAVGDIDGDGTIEIVVATTESEKAEDFIALGRVYAFRSDGQRVPGFPVKPFGAMAETFPVVGSGVPGTPVLVDLDGDGAAEVVAGHAAGQLVAFRGDGSVAAAFDHGTLLALISPFGPPVSLADDRYQFNALLLSQPIAGDLDGDGVPEVMAPTMGIPELNIAEAQENPGELLTKLETVFSVWRADGTIFEPWPLATEGWALFGGATLVDVDADGIVEIVYGSDAGWLHARNVTGKEAAGFPKFVGGWMGPVAAAGDLDGDGALELVTATRQGQVFAWSTGAPQCLEGHSSAPWPLHHHDARGTSDATIADLECATDGDVTIDVVGGCSCRTTPAHGGLAGPIVAGLLSLVVCGRRRRRGRGKELTGRQEGWKQ